MKKKNMQVNNNEFDDDCALIPFDEEDSLFLEEEESLEVFPPVPKEKESKYLGILKNILPYLGSDETKIILAEVMIALKLEGIIGERLSKNESNMVYIIKDSIMQEPGKKKQAINFAQKLLE
jgi:hypothetical protein